MGDRSLGISFFSNKKKTKNLSFYSHNISVINIIHEYPHLIFFSIVGQSWMVVTHTLSLYNNFLFLFGCFFHVPCLYPYTFCCCFYSSSSSLLLKNDVLIILILYVFSELILNFIILGRPSLRKSFMSPIPFFFY